MHFKVCATFLIVCMIPLCTPFGLGAPDVACGDMIPRHGPSPQTSTPPYTISPNTTMMSSGERITIRIEAQQTPLKGFFIQAMTSGSESPVGVFYSPIYKTLTCGKGFNNAITHAGPQEKSDVTLQWEAPSDMEGDVIFRSTIVENRNVFWVDAKSSPVKVEKRSVDTRVGDSNSESADTTTTTTATTTSTTTTTTTTPLPLQGIAKLVDEIYQDCGIFKTCLGLPNKCVEKKNCKSLYTFTQASSSKYEFEMMGELQEDPQYLAIGLSFDENMGDDSVVVCENGESTDIYHTWNRGKNNEKIADLYKGLSEPKTGTYEGKLYCSFKRNTITRINGEVFDLDSNKYHILIASGSVGGGQTRYHGPNQRLASDRLVSLGDTSKLSSKDDRLMKTIHACLMIGAWIGAASCGMLFARYYKKTWLSNKCMNIDQWFHMHRLFMVSTWCLTIAGFIVVVYDLKEFRVSNHSLVGVVSVGLCFIQPFMAALRPHPTANTRAVFNWLHWFVGNAAQILGVAAIFLGTEIYFGSERQWVKEISWYILVVFIGFHILCHLILSFGQCVSDCRTHPEEDAFPMKDVSDSQMALQAPDFPRDAPGGCLRKFILGLYLPINWIATTLLILGLVFKRETLEEEFTSWGLPAFWENV